METNFFNSSSSLSTVSSNSNEKKFQKENLFNQKIWKDFPDFWLTFTYENITTNLKKLISEKKTFFFIYMEHMIKTEKVGVLIV